MNTLPHWHKDWVKPPIEPSRIATEAEFAYLRNFGPNPVENVNRPVMMAEADRLAGIDL